MVVKAVVVAIVLLLTACAGQDEFIRFDTGSAVHLDSTDKVLIAVPADVAYRSGGSPGSGESTAHIVRAAFTDHTDNAGPLPEARNLGDVHAMAGRENYDYLVTPTIFRWDQGEANDDSSPYRIEVKIDVVDIATDKVVASGLAIGQSGTEASGGDEPEALLSTSVDEFVEALYEQR